MATLVPLSTVDPGRVEDLLDAAFGTDRHGRTAYRIREGTAWLPGLSFAALDACDVLVGSIQLWPVALTDAAGRAHPMLMLGPVAVLPGLANTTAPGAFPPPTPAAGGAPAPTIPHACSCAAPRPACCRAPAR
jgi:hypothetical protein